MVLAQICAGSSIARARAQVTQPAAAAGGPVDPAGRVACAVCHQREAALFTASIHAGAGIDCRSCHGGENEYTVPPGGLERLRRLAGEWSEREEPTSRPAETTTRPAAGGAFDHGPQFRGKASHYDVPQRCGTCHSDVAKMNPYGLPTDQWAQYRMSGHGRALYDRKSDKVAVCIDCHGTHDIRKHTDPASPVYPTNVPGTCGKCHARASVMIGSHLNMSVVEEYKQSVHGQGLLEHGDVGMPHCATCHGSHAAIPPGFRDVGHVCGRCHQQEEQRFLESVHAKFPNFPRCMACHTRNVDQRDHRIVRVAASPESIKKTCEQVLEALPSADIRDPKLQAAYAAQRKPPVPSFEAFCQRCHTPARQIAHRAFFGDLDQRAAGMGAELYQLVQHAELCYGVTAEQVGRVSRGVLLVKDEAMTVEEMRTKMVGLAALQHTLDAEKVRAAVADLDALASRTQQSLGEKVRGLRWRYWGLIPMWAFLALFSVALWVKYKRLKAAWVVSTPQHDGRLQHADIA